MVCETAREPIGRHRLATRVCTTPKKLDNAIATGLLTYICGTWRLTDPDVGLLSASRSTSTERSLSRRRS